MLARRLMASGGGYGLLEYATAGSYALTLPSSATRLRVTVIGAGGGGGGNTAGSPGGGGGAGFAMRATRTVNGGDTLSITVGAPGGLNGANGDPGGISSVVYNPTPSTVQASGGSGGSGFPGAGGTGGASYTLQSGWTLVDSQVGANGASALGSDGGSGGSLTAFYGVSGTGGAGGIFATATRCTNATGHGSGGGGAYQGQPAGTGWLGSPGLVRVEWNY